MTQKQLTELLSTMTIEEKAAQLTQLTPASLGAGCVTPLTGPDCGLRMPPELCGAAGSVLNCSGAREATALQKAHLEKDPHHIPLLFMADIVHGFRTVFPIPLAMGCSFSPAAAEEACRIAAEESAASGVHVTFSPMADLVRDPRWGRVMEAYGEDPLLNSRMCTASVKGYQGEGFKDPRSVVSCVKHFAAYGAPEGGREYNTVDLSEGVLRETYLPAYRASLAAGAGMVMTSFNTVDRVPASASRLLLQRILREEWGFTGPVISDYNAVGELVSHGVAADGGQAAAQALSAGVDVEMMSLHYVNSLRQALAEGAVTEQSLDEAVLRVLTLKNELGLFEAPFRGADPEAETRCHLSPAHRQAARRIAGQSIVLLKNEHVLPLDAGGRKIGLTGPFAASRQVLGGWSAGNTEGVSLYEGLCGRFSEGSLHPESCGELVPLQEGGGDIPPLPAGFAARFSDCDVVIAAVGEHQSDTGEGASKAFLRLSPRQELLLQELAAAGKKVVAVIFSGRPLELAPVLPSCSALVQAWFPGTEAGNALADILSGDVNPSARLSMSFPYTVGQIPVYYNHFRTGRPEMPENAGTRYVSRYLDCPAEPLFCFGFGLSYSEFVYSGLRLLRDGSGLSAAVTVANLSAAEGTETVQLYIGDVTASAVRPVKELKDFRRVRLAAGESQTVIFRLTREMLSFYREGGFGFEAGRFTVMIGRNAQDTLSETIFIDEALIGKEQP